jgi:predicted Zn-dependent protease with MMP-like domain
MPLYSTPPSIADCEDLARRAFADLPETFRRFVGDVVIRVVDFPDAETEEEMELETPFDLLGLYRGVDMGSKSVSFHATGRRSDLPLSPPAARFLGRDRRGPRASDPPCAGA